MTITLADIKKMDMNELTKKLGDLREEIRHIHFKADGSRSKNVKEESMKRKTIARILTEINQINKNNTKK